MIWREAKLVVKGREELQPFTPPFQKKNEPLSIWTQRNGLNASLNRNSGSISRKPNEPFGDTPQNSSS